MTNRKIVSLLLETLVSLSLLPTLAVAQTHSVPGGLLHDMQSLVETPAVPGHEAAVIRRIADELKAYSPKIDSLGSATVTIGDGPPHRLIVAPVDEPGFVVSQITPDGYLRLQRLPQFGDLPLFNELHSAQPMWVLGRNGKRLNGAMAGLSVHVQPGRKNPPDMNDIENLYVDVGAERAAQVAQAGIEVLAPVAMQRSFRELADGKVAGPAVGDRFGDVALLQLIRSVDPAKLKGSVTFAFVVQGWAGARGLVQLLNREKADELIFIGRSMPARTPAPAAARGDSGVTVVLDTADGPLGELGDELKSLAEKNNIKVSSVVAAPLLPHSYLPLPKLPTRTVHLSVPIWWPVTPGEIVDSNDIGKLVQLLEVYLTGSSTPIPRRPPKVQNIREYTPIRATAPTSVRTLQSLVESYGVSDHETATRETVQSLLPPWAKPTVGPKGDLVLDWGDKSKAPELVVVAHMDEIGYEVKSVLPDGRLDLEDKGGGLLPFFEGHVTVVHSANGQHAGVLELPEGWQKPDFKFRDERNPRVFADVGAANPEEVAKLGIKIGDFLTVPKKYEPLIGQRAMARSFDDRVGCTALVQAAWKLGPQLNGRRVTFVWSTGEELGLVGAASYAKQMTDAGKAPKYVFAVDTFVSSDSPLESKRFGDGIVGDGFVIRAVDNSNIVPLADVQKLRRLTAAQKIPTQYGVTGGGNDGSAFVPYGSIDVAMGWPLRYSHSPGEVIDVRDVDALARAVETVARSW